MMTMTEKDDKKVVTMTEQEYDAWWSLVESSFRVLKVFRGKKSKDGGVND